jgi:hypothetical protein
MRVARFARPSFVLASFFVCCWGGSVLASLLGVVSCPYSSAPRGRASVSVLRLSHAKCTATRRSSWLLRLFLSRAVEKKAFQPAWSLLHFFVLFIAHFKAKALYLRAP